LDGIATDITERKSLEAQFLRAQRLESIGRLASGIAHDLNNILSPVLMGAQLLQLRLPNADDQRLLEVMLGNIERGADMVKQILLFARGIQGERIQLQPKHLIREIVKVVTDTFPKSVQIKSSIPEDPWLVLGDTTQIHQVLMNLCINARDAMPNGGTLTIRTENMRLDEIYTRMNPEAKTGEYVLITVADTGEGIPQQLLSKIFDPFFTTKEQGKGTGLGLSTVQGIVKSHGGFINVYSEVGKGTEFKIYLPAAESPHAISETVQTDWPMGNGELILVVDDEAAVRELAKNVLEMFGYQTLVAIDGAEAIAIYAERRDEIQVVVTDLMMPVMDGPATIRALQRLDPKIRIIAVSGLTGNGRMLEAAQAGVKLFLPKPYTADRLLKAIAEILR
jgi:nitrogen-specific signal transduction histidine kinase/CheY-like chemotaxis protein